jgi:hypothetical protein
MPSEERQRYADTARLLYYKWKTLEDSTNWLFRPRTVMKFFDYYLLSIFDTPRAIGALEQAFRESADDKSLADRSIYKVVVPQLLADYYSFSGQHILHELEASSIALSDGVMDEVGGKLIQAVKFSTDAFRFGSEESDRRGDILFWHLDQNYALDLDRLTQIYWSAAELFKEGLWKTCGISKQDLLQFTEFARKKGVTGEKIAKLKKLCDN